MCRRRLCRRLRGPGALGELKPVTTAEPITMVLADDVEELRALVRIQLERDGRFAVVGEASNGREAVDLTADLQPNLVLLDLAMPVMDGLEALVQIHDVSPDSRVLIYSGFEGPSIRKRALSLCADGYTVKGAAPERLIADVMSVVQSPPKCR